MAHTITGWAWCCRKHQHFPHKFSKYFVKCHNCPAKEKRLTQFWDSIFGRRSWNQKKKYFLRFMLVMRQTLICWLNRALIHQMIWINYNCLTSTDKAPHHIIINTILYVYGQRSFVDECIHTNHSQIEKQTYTTNERENRPLCVVWTHNLTKSMSTNKWPKHTRVSIHYYTRKYIYIDGVRLILIK